MAANKNQNKNTMEITWREFEKLVSKLEEALSPIGARIKTPDKLKDFATGQMREVDGSIRFLTKKGEILITIECRKRGQRQDITWIEQLVTKKTNLKAYKTIAVSSKGFSQSAQTLANQHDIILKTLIDVNPVSVAEWLIPKSIVNLFREIKLICITAFYYDGNQNETYITNRIEDNNFFDKNRREIPVPAILGWFEDYLTTHNPDVLFSAPLDGSSKKSLTLKKNIEKGNLFLKGNNNYFDITMLLVAIELSYIHTITDVDQGRHYIYDDIKNRFQVSEFDSTNDQLPFTFRHLANKNGMLSSFEINKKSQS